MHDEGGWAKVVNFNEKRLIFDSVGMLLTDLHIDPDQSRLLELPFLQIMKMGMANEFRFSFGGIHSLLKLETG